LFILIFDFDLRIKCGYLISPKGKYLVVDLDGIFSI